MAKVTKSIRINKEILEKTEEDARKDLRSLSAQIEFILWEYFTNKENENQENK